MPFNPMEGPIPGENFTSDTKNYAWHRPPEIDDLDTAIETCFKKLMEKNASVSVLTMLEMGVDIATLTDMFVTQGISKGKWTPDFALLLAGPVAHIIYLMAKGYGMEPNLGIDNGFKAPTKALFESYKKIDEARANMAANGINLDAVQNAAESQLPLDEQTGLGGNANATAQAPSSPMTSGNMPPKTGMMAGMV